MLVLSLHVTHVGRGSGIPTYRTKVLYIPQRPSLLPLTPRDFVFTVLSFSAQKRQNHESGLVRGERSDSWMDRPLEVGSRFSIDPDLWNRNWTELSGGEGQRIMMAIGVALGTAEVLLLDGEFPLVYLYLYLPLYQTSVARLGTMFFFSFDTVWIPSCA